MSGPGSSPPCVASGLRDPVMDWKPGDRLTHRFNPELGPGQVSGVDGRTVLVVFPASGTTLQLAILTMVVTGWRLALTGRVLM